MSNSGKTRKITILAASAAVGLSATAIVLLEQPSTSGERLSLIQSALRDGAASAKVSGNASEWLQLACGKSKCND